MTDEESADTPTEPEAKPGGFSFMRGGGTATSKSEALYKRRFHEAEQRRDVSDQERAAARLPTEHGGAQLLTNQMTRHPEIPKAFILLKFVNKRGEDIIVNGEPVCCCADLIVGMNPMRPTELTLVMVCPRCQQSSHKHQQDNQIMIRQSNKWFEFKTGMGPQTFVFEGKTFKSAGVIVQSEKFRCHDCGWQARIDKNRVWPD